MAGLWFDELTVGQTFEHAIRRTVTETSGFANTAGFNDDTRAFLSIPARHDVARRIDLEPLAQTRELGARIGEERLSIHGQNPIATEGVEEPSDLVHIAAPSKVGMMLVFEAVRRGVVEQALLLATEPVFLTLEGFVEVEKPVWDKFATTPELQRKLLVDNPMRLYWGR